MEEDLEGLDLEDLEEELERMHESRIKDLEEIILSTKGQKRWLLLESIALQHNYVSEDKDSYRHDKDYLMKINNRIIYLEDVTKQEYKEIREALERRDSLNKSTKLMVNALTLGSSALGGGVLGYLLMEAGLNPVVMIPSIIVPVGLALYDILKQSIKESKQWDEINKSLSKYKKNMSYDDDAARRFNRTVYERAVKGKI